MRIVVRAVIAAGVVHAVAACTLTMPIASLANDDEITGSVTPTPAPTLSPKLDAEDLRRATAALALAVDPQGNGAPVSWDNPVSGRKGSFAAAGPLYILEDRVCRSFIATMAGGGADAQMQGSACRLGPNEWMLREIKPWSRPG